MANILTVENIRGYVDETGTAYLNAEDVARGWGFVQKQSKSGKVYESIRWSTLNEYLKEFGFPQLVGENDFLPENIVYRLGFKAKNEKAVAFQIKLSDEILPSIRKTGSYSQLPNFNNPAEAARAWADEYEKRCIAQNEVKYLTNKIEEQKPKVNYYDVVLKSKDAVLVSVIAQDYGMTAKAFNSLLYENGIQHKLDNTWVLYAKYVGNGYTKSETYSYTKPNGENGTKVHTKWTQKGRLFLYEFLKNIGVLPNIEK